MAKAKDISHKLINPDHENQQLVRARLEWAFPLPNGLGSNDVGRIVWDPVTDRINVFTGAAWANDFGDRNAYIPKSGQVRFVGNYILTGSAYNTYTTISDAITASYAGDLIIVYPNHDHGNPLYLEQIKISKKIHIHCMPGVVIKNPASVPSNSRAIVWMNCDGASFTGYAKIQNNEANDWIGEVYIDEPCRFECDTIEYTGNGVPQGTIITGTTADIDIKFIKTKLLALGSTVNLKCDEISYLGSFSSSSVPSNVTIDANIAQAISAFESEITGNVKYFGTVDAAAVTQALPSKIVLTFFKNLYKRDESSTNTYYPVRAWKSSYVELIDGTIETESGTKGDHRAIPVLISGQASGDDKGNPNYLGVCRLKHVRVIAKDVEFAASQICVEMRLNSKLIADHSIFVSSGNYSIGSDGAGTQWNVIKNYFSVANKDVGPDIAVLVRNPMLIDPEVE